MKKHVKSIKLSLVWPPQPVVTESLFRHYNGLAETAGYLENKSLLFKHYNFDISIHDCAVKTYTAMNMSKIVHTNDIIAICVNMNNIVEAIKTAKFFKSIDENKIIIAYGEGVCSNPRYFSQFDFFDFIISNGQYELGLEIALSQYYNFNKEFLHPILLQESSFYIENKIVWFSSEVLLPPEDWGIPFVDKLPLEEYIAIGQGELHITACKGCPYNCEFCNEKYVSSTGLRYRPAKQIVDFLLENRKQFKTAYLDSSTFTYDKSWVLNFCKQLIKHKEDIIPWKTCTRLDCIDEEIISLFLELATQYDYY